MSGYFQKPGISNSFYISLLQEKLRVCRALFRSADDPDGTSLRAKTLLIRCWKERTWTHVSEEERGLHFSAKICRKESGSVLLVRPSHDAESPF
jgi:hypothetical protein